MLTCVYLIYKINISIQYLINMKIIFIKNANAKLYYAVNADNIAQVSKIPELFETGYRMDYNNITEVIKDKEYLFDKVKIRGEYYFINSDTSYRIAQFDYVTDEAILKKLNIIYQEYLNRKTNNVAFMFDFELEKYDWIQVRELGDNSSAIIEIHYDDTNPTTKRKKRNM